MLAQHLNPIPKIKSSTLWLVIILLWPTTITKCVSIQSENDLDLVMPGATSSGKDSYRCASYAFNNHGDNSYITQFTANANASKAHHIIIQKCKNPMKPPGQIWDCIHHSICKDMSHVMYAWAKDAPPTYLPKDVAFSIQPNEYLVMQIHYANPFNEPDHTSVTVRTSSKSPKYHAGIYLLWKNYLVIPPGKPQVNGDMNCISNIDPPIHVFAYRPHAHSLGKKVLGIKTDGKTGQASILANGDPQKPQAFYPLPEPITIEKGDNLFARCVYDSTKSKKTTYIGSTAGDEMCNLYLMFYSEAKGHDFFTCARNDDPSRSNTADELSAQLSKLESAGNVEKAPKSLSFPEEKQGPPLRGSKLDFTAEIGDICGITYDVYGNIVILNRGNHRWDGSTFSWGNEYQGDKNSPISMDTVVTLNSSGHVISSWGKDFFFLPHMITIDSENNVWITDVAMHQVFKFGPYGGLEKKPLIELGQRFKPGGDDLHYCKPTAVAVSSDARTFFVSDGYCNQRVIKYAIKSINSNGYHSVVKIMSFGAKQIPNQPKWNPNVYNFNVPHALALIESMTLICVADRENGIVQCFNATDGTFQNSVMIAQDMEKVYSVDSFGEKLAILAGPNSQNKAKLMVYDLSKNQVQKAVLASDNEIIGNPHDVAFNKKNGDQILVANLNPSELWLFGGEPSKRKGKQVLSLASQELPKAIVIKTAADNDTPLWKSFGLVLVFITGLSMIIYYIRSRRRKLGGGFQPLNTKDEEDDL